MNSAYTFRVEVLLRGLDVPGIWQTKDLDTDAGNSDRGWTL